MRARIRDLIVRLRGEGIGAVLARGAVAFLATQLAGVGIAFGTQVLLARLLGLDDYGTYVWVQSWLVLLLLFCRFGLGTASLRYVAQFTAQEDWPRLRGFLRLTHVSVLAASLVVAGGTAAAVLAVGPRLSDAARHTFLVGCLALPPYAFLQLWGYVLRGFKRAVLSMFPSAVLQPALLALLAAGALVSARPVGAPDAMWMLLGSVLGGLALSAVGLRRSVPKLALRAAPRFETGEWLRTSLPMLLMNLLVVLQQRASILLLGTLQGAPEAGLYAPASGIAGLVSFGLNAVNAWTAPLISDLHARGDRVGIQRLVHLAVRGLSALTLPLFLVVLFFGRPILSLFGPGFEEAYGALVVLAAGEMVSALAGPVTFLMTMTGRQNAAARILAVNAVLMLGLCVLLIPTYGVLGAAIATTVAQASWNVMMAVAVWRSLGVRTTLW